MDCQMPEMDGYTAAASIRRLHGSRALPIIAMTANAMADDRQRCLDAGMDDYLAKPFSTERLSELLEAIPERSTMAMEAGTPGRPVLTSP